MPISGWEAVVLGYVERIRHELALIEGDIDPTYQRLFDACSHVSQHANAKAVASPSLHRD